MTVDERERTTRRERFGRDTTVRASHCISADELGAMRDGRLPEARRTAISEHLAACAACREFFAKIVACNKELNLPENDGVND